MIKKLKQLKNHQGFIKYFSNTSWVLGERILRMAVGLFVSIWVARYLGPEDFGLLSYSISFVGIFAVIAKFGLDGIIVRELVSKPDKENTLLGTAFLLKFIGAFIVLVILAIAISFTSSDLQTKTLLFIIASATVFQSFNTIDLYFQAKVLSKYVAFSNSISMLISSSLKIYFILNQFELIYFAYVILFDSITLALGLLYFFYRKNKNIFIWKFNYSMAKSLLKDSWPLILSGVLISINMKIDQVMIKEILNNEAVGQYAAAVRLSEAWYFIPMVICASLFPAILNSKNKDRTLYMSRLQNLYNLMAWMAIAIAIPMSFLSDWTINLLYGEQYKQAGDVLMIHVWTGIFVFLGQAFNRYLTAENLTRIALYRTALGAISNIFLNYLLIPSYGINGAALATLTSSFISNYAYDFIDPNLKEQRRMKTRSLLPFHLIKFKKTL